MSEKVFQDLPSRNCKTEDPLIGSWVDYFRPLAQKAREANWPLAREEYPWILGVCQRLEHLEHEYMDLQSRENEEAIEARKELQLARMKIGKLEKQIRELKNDTQT